MVFRGSFELPARYDGSQITLFYKSIGKEQSIYINGKEIARSVKEESAGNNFVLDQSNLHPGKNNIAIIAIPLVKKNPWESVNSDPGLIQVITPPAPWKRKLFSGLAQVIVQSTSEAGEITLTATSPGLKAGVLKIQSTVPEKVQAVVK
jgi:beta-galactosidase